MESGTSAGLTLQNGATGSFSKTMNPTAALTPYFTKFHSITLAYIPQLDRKGLELGTTVLW
jgi:hypothetical protein